MYTENALTVTRLYTFNTGTFVHLFKIDRKPFDCKKNTWQRFRGLKASHLTFNKTKVLKISISVQKEKHTDNGVILDCDALPICVLLEDLSWYFGKTTTYEH